MLKPNIVNINEIAKQVEELLVKYPQAEELFNSNAKKFKSLFDKWKFASDSQRRSSNQTQKLPPNPALWEIEDKLCWHYVTLGIIRDMIYADRVKPIVKDILQGKNPVTDAFSFIRYLIEEGNHTAYFSDSIELALSQVQQDLAIKPAETKLDIPPSKGYAIKARLEKLVEKAWQILTKTFWETIFERIFGPR